MAIRGTKLTFGGGKNFWEYKSSRKPIRKTKKKVATFFLFLFFGDSKNCILCRGAI